MLPSKATLTQDLTYDLCPQEAHILVNTFYPLDILESQPNLGHVCNVGGRALDVIQSSHLPEVRPDVQKGCGFKNKLSDGQWINNNLAFCKQAQPVTWPLGSVLQALQCRL